MPTTLNKKITTKDFNSKYLDLFWQFITLRQTVWYKRFVLKSSQPWTKDIILQKERFTNIYRELDPGTAYAKHMILETSNSKADKIFNIMLYRLIGRSTTHEQIGFQHLLTFNPEKLEKQLKYIRDGLNMPPFTAAYMVSGYSMMGSHDKIENIVKIFTEIQKDFDTINEKIDKCKSSQEAYNVIQRIQGFGTFLAYQVLVDLLYPLAINNGKPLLPYSNNDFSSAGPGAKRGINILLKEKGSRDNLSVMKWLQSNQEEEFQRLNLKFPYLKNSKGEDIEISLSNIQNCLCEFHKYVKIREHTGKGRRKFHPTTTSSILNL